MGEQYAAVLVTVEIAAVEAEQKLPCITMHCTMSLLVVDVVFLL